jgi:hydroxyethylthiazole kinase-like uncharacterized protein yjeF
MPLPALSSNSDKDARGRVLVAGGSAAVPGAVLLAGVAALRSGAGKLQLATVRESAPGLGLAVPEALIVALPPTRAGEIAAARAVTALRPHATTADAVLLGPGMLPNRACHRLVAAIVRLLRGDATLVLDAGALIALRGHEQILMPLGGRAVLTPHAGEMAAVLGIEKRDVEAAAPDAARLAADRFGAVVALKGADTWIAEPNGGLLHYRGGSVGLATSGSGDTLAGIIAGIAARGAPALPAAVWGVWAHGTAGQRLARRMAKVGFLARELLAEVPSLVGRD